MSIFDSFFPAAFADGHTGAGSPASSSSLEPRDGGCGCGCHSDQAPTSVAESGRDGATEALLERTLNRWVMERPGAVRVLSELGLDACCGGERSLADACRRHGLDAEDVLARLLAA